MFHNLSRHKYKITIFGLLVGASVVSVTLAIARMEYSDTREYVFLVKNLILAWIPFLIAYIAYTLTLARKLLYVIIPVSAFVWLIFFPNAPYILTDLQHLALGPVSAPIWFDVILFIWFAWTGLLLGIVSLYLMQEIVRREFGRVIGWIFVVVVACLSSIGMYLGRFLRWNSWDVLQNPTEISRDVWGWMRDPNLQAFGFAALFTIFFLFIYLILYAFGHLLQEQKVKES
jgi:uncharacterized membrane protein